MTFDHSTFVVSRFRANKHFIKWHRFKWIRPVCVAHLRIIYMIRIMRLQKLSVTVFFSVSQARESTRISHTRVMILYFNAIRKCYLNQFKCTLYNAMRLILWFFLQVIEGELALEMEMVHNSLFDNTSDANESWYKLFCLCVGHKIQDLKCWI